MPLPPDRISISDIPLPLMLVDHGGRVIQSNVPAQEAIGHSNRKLAGMHLSDIFQPASEIERILGKDAAENSSSLDVSIRNSSLPVSFHLGQSESGMTVVFVPEAYRMEMEQQDRRQEMAEAVARIALEMAHEVKNPLAALRGATQWLAEQDISNSAREAVAQMLNGVDRIRDRIDAFLQVGPRAAVQMEMTNIHALIQDVTRYREGLRVERVFDPSLPEILVHAPRFRQALENLWQNALEAAESHIEWQTRIAPLVHLPGHQGQVIEIRITNDGQTVPEHMREHLFEPYITGKERGSGLGLALVQRVMVEHKGRVSAHFEHGRTSLILHLPLIVEEAS
ncbi:MAG TPA: ATP-binding protein [Mariprofundaceae bacterium]|nr:ATP-binding protein [Mariprofundaceae bacterium]